MICQPLTVLQLSENYPNAAYARRGRSDTTSHGFVWDLQLKMLKCGKYNFVIQTYRQPHTVKKSNFEVLCRINLSLFNEFIS